MKRAKHGCFPAILAKFLKTTSFSEYFWSTASWGNYKQIVHMCNEIFKHIVANCNVKCQWNAIFSEYTDDSKHRILTSEFMKSSWYLQFSWIYFYSFYY